MKAIEIVRGRIREIESELTRLGVQRNLAGVDYMKSSLRMWNDLLIINQVILARLKE